MAGIDTGITTPKESLKPRFNKLAIVMAISAALNFSSCKNPHSSQEGQKIEQTVKDHYESVDFAEVIKKGEDGNMYIDENYRYPIRNENGKFYLNYNNIEFELKGCHRVNGNNRINIYVVVHNGNTYYIISDEIYEGSTISFYIGRDGDDSLKIYNPATKKETPVIN